MTEQHVDAVQAQSSAPTPFHIFYSRTQSMQVIDSRGQPIVFVSGRFHTRDEAKISFLNQMIADGTQSIFLDPDNLTMAADQLDPMNVLKAKHIREYLEQQAQFLDPNQDGGTSVQTKLNAASTTSIAAVAAGGGPGSIANRIHLGAAAAK